MRFPQINLFLLPYAGGAAGVFRPWAAELPDWINPVALTLPGRAARYAQPVLHDWPSLIEVVLEDCRPYLDRPFAVFGHSMGALTGLELAHAIRARHGISPVWFGASGCTAPVRRVRELKWLSCPEAELLDEMRAMGGTAAELLDNRDLLDLLLPALRADFHLCGSYRARRRERLACPLLVLGGTADRISTPLENLLDWSTEVSGAWRLEMLEAGHFFITEHRDAVIRATIESLQDALSLRDPAHA